MSAAPSVYAVPDSPADPVSAALELIVRVPADLLGVEHLRAALQELTLMLDAADAFVGLTWLDARQVAAAVAYDACSGQDAAVSMRRRAVNVRSDSGRTVWDNPVRAAAALDIAAEVMSL
ncbi:amino acid aminotransferase [Mycobacterium sp. MBM]|nr:amino acid aminotransferase [Mycobacterium sp. MBM]